MNYIVQYHHDCIDHGDSDNNNHDDGDNVDDDGSCQIAEPQLIPIYFQSRFTVTLSMSTCRGVFPLQVVCGAFLAASASPTGCPSTLTFSHDNSSWSEGNGNIHAQSLSPWRWRWVHGSRGAPQYSHSSTSGRPNSNSFGSRNVKLGQSRVPTLMFMEKKKQQYSSTQNSEIFSKKKCLHQLSIMLHFYLK